MIDSEWITVNYEETVGSLSMKFLAHAEIIYLLQILKIPKENSKRSRVVVITQGADPTIVAHDGKVSFSSSYNLLNTVRSYVSR